MSKWANRLKDVLTKTENLEVCLNSQLTKADETPQKLVSSAFVSGQFRDSVKNNVFGVEKQHFQKTEQSLKKELTITDETEIKDADSASLTERLNRMIAAGVTFEISADDFQTFGASNRENIFLQENKSAILCTLQQGALMKFLPLDNINFFIDEVRERAAIMSYGATIEPPFDVVCEIIKDWFADVLEELGRRER